MTKEEKIQYWMDLADDDIHVAEDLLKTKHHLQAVFFCHLAIEKIFKAYYSKLREETPPFRHELDILAIRGGFFESMSDEQKAFADSLNPFNIEARYPEHKSMLAKTLNDKHCEYFLNETKNLLQWTKEKILSVK